MEHKQLFDYCEAFPAEFAAADSFAAFAAALDGSKPGPGKLLQHIAAKYPGSYERAFQTIKAHGFTGRALLLPHARKAADIFAHVGLYPYETGGLYRHQLQYVQAGAAFVSGHRAKGFDYFGRLGADYVRDGRPYISGGLQVLTAAKPTPAVIEAYGHGPGAGEWDLATFEAVRWEDGRTLITLQAVNGFGRDWLCILDAGESAFAMLSEHERGEIEAERARKAEQQGSAA